jgi:hypothetical protein
MISSWVGAVGSPVCHDVKGVKTPILGWNEVVAPFTLTVVSS